MRWIHHEPLGHGQKLVFGIMMAAVVLVAFAGWRAWTISPLPSSGGSSGAGAVPELGERVSYPLQTALRAVVRDPFHPERRAPTARYLLPEQEAGDAILSDPAPGGPVRLLGTVVNERTGGFAMAQVGRGAPRMVHVGDTLGGLTLRSVGRATADFTDSRGEVITVQLPRAAAGGGR